MHVIYREHILIKNLEHILLKNIEHTLLKKGGPLTLENFYQARKLSSLITLP
jgi:hypothetical protein